MMFYVDVVPKVMTRMKINPITGLLHFMSKLNRYNSNDILENFNVEEIKK